jgi:hypothetical protein
MGDRFGNQISTAAFWVLWTVGLAVNLGVGVPMTVLVAYHVFFQQRSISTYNYLTNNYSESPSRLQSFCWMAGNRMKIAAV